ncbi:MAG: hypothetical protein ABSG69_17630 [Candidatus Acidiferrum sp.]|jgi:hypothetical protein
MQVNLHFVMLEDLSDARDAATGDNTVARIEIIRECSPGEVEFDDLSSDAGSQA